MKRSIGFAIIFSFFTLCGATSFSQVIDSSFYGWTVYEMKTGEYGNKKCYMISHPTTTKSNHNNRSNPYIVITRYQNERHEEVGIYGGFEYKINSNVFVAIDDLKFTFITNKDMAWTQTKSQDSFIIQEILNRKNLLIRSDSSVGTFAVDDYSLKGIAKAYNRIKTICSS